MTFAAEAIYTGSSGDGLCCLAAKHGIGYGLNSKHVSVCPYAERWEEHHVHFVDNPFKNYNHDKHLAVVERLKPKYATVIDIMSREECALYDTAYYPVERILRFAEDLEPHCERVIAIPKIDCIADIPQRYMLGYSVPTSYGGTTLPYTAFEDRPVHLLGGSWRQIRDIIRLSGMNVVSFDIAHIHKIAKSGLFVDRRGVEYKLSDALPNFSANPLYTCMALSFAAIAKELSSVRLKKLHSQHPLA